MIEFAWDVPGYRLAITANCMGIEPFTVKPGSSTRPVPGFNVTILDSNGKQAAPKTTGLVTIKLPLPPGTLPTLWQGPTFPEIVSQGLSRVLFHQRWRVRRRGRIRLLSWAAWMT